MDEPGSIDDANAVIGGLLRDLAFVQPARPQMFGYKRAAAAVLAHPEPLSAHDPGALPRIAGVGPASQRVIREVLERGVSATVEAAVDTCGKREEIERRRTSRRHVLSRAEVLRVLREPRPSVVSLEDYRGDLQMHSEWSDGVPTLRELAEACAVRGYRFSAVTDHSHGLKIAGGMSPAEAAAQRRAVAEINQIMAPRFRLLHGVEANIGFDGRLDLSAEEAASFTIVLAAPHSRLRRMEDQTERLLTAIAQPAVRILAHPRGRMAGSRTGIVADWPRVFATAASHGVAVEIDGDPARQDLDHVLARQALAAGCLFALDSDAHTADQLVYAETAVAHARLAGVPPTRVVNCWPLERLLAWVANPSAEHACVPGRRDAGEARGRTPTTHLGRESAPVRDLGDG
jgi:histidinol phosphatase-like PHP family hydrolase